MYKVDFGVCVDAKQPLVFQLFLNDNAVANSDIILDSNTFACKSILLDATENSKLTLRVTSLTGLFTFDKDKNYAYLTIIPVFY